MLESLITSVLAFAATNIDDAFLLMLFYSSKKYKPSQIVTGQYAGMVVLVAVSFAGAWAGSLIDSKYIGLLGLFPIYLGIKHFLNKEQDDEKEIKYKNTNGIASVALITIANGADNIGVYIPLLITLDTAGRTVLIIVFAIMILLLCLMSQYLAKHPLLAKPLDKYGHFLMPVVLCLLGVYILVENDVISLFR